MKVQCGEPVCSKRIAAKTRHARGLKRPINAVVTIDRPASFLAGL